jgi:hypothetical protein
VHEKVGKLGNENPKANNPNQVAGQGNACDSLVTGSQCFHLVYHISPLSIVSTIIVQLKMRIRVERMVAFEQELYFISWCSSPK